MHHLVPRRSLQRQKSADYNMFNIGSMSIGRFSSGFVLGAPIGVSDPLLNPLNQLSPVIIAR